MKTVERWCREQSGAGDPEEAKSSEIHVREMRSWEQDVELSSLHS